jgi:hypothetical protein
MPRKKLKPVKLHGAVAKLPLRLNHQQPRTNDSQHSAQTGVASASPILSQPKDDQE